MANVSHTMQSKPLFVQKPGLFICQAGLMGAALGGLTSYSQFTAILSFWGQLWAGAVIGSAFAVVVVFTFAYSESLQRDQENYLRRQKADATLKKAMATENGKIEQHYEFVRCYGYLRGFGNVIFDDMPIPSFSTSQAGQGELPGEGLCDLRIASLPHRIGNLDVVVITVWKRRKAVTGEVL